MLINLSIVILLILLNGVFAMTELAVVSSRRPRLLAAVETGSKGAKAALQLKDDPSKFLSTVQIGITLIGIFSGAYSGITIAETLAVYLRGSFPLLEEHADEISIALVVTAVTYLSLIIGELVPKQIALKYADEVAIAIALPIRWLSLLARPLVAILDISNRVVLTLLRVRQEEGTPTSEEDVKAVIAEGTATGALDQQEKHMLERVLNLDDIPIRATMTHRQEVVWLEAHEPEESVIAKMLESGHSHYPLCDGGRQHIVGAISAKDLAIHFHNGGGADYRAIATPALTMPENATIREALEHFRASKVHIASIVDEYGSLEGIITLKDILEAIVGILPEHVEGTSPTAHRRDDGSWLVDGLLPLFEVETALGAKDMQEEGSSYTTLAGFLLHHLGHIPAEGEKIFWRQWWFEVIDMDGNRIDKILITPAEIQA